MEGMMPMPTKPSPFWLAEANYDSCYAGWLQRLDDLCDHFLDIRFRDLIAQGSDLDPHDAYYVQKCRPEMFLRECVVPYLENEHGAEFIHDHIGENIMWGARRPESP